MTVPNKPTVGETAWGSKLNTALDWLDANKTNVDLSSVGTTILPTTDNAVALGSSTKRFSSIYLGPGTLNITDSVLNTNSAIGVANGVFNISGISKAQFPNVKLTTLTFNDNSTMTTAAKPLYNGSFEDTSTNQVSGGTTTANLVTVNSTTTSNGVSVVSGSKITFANAGDYYVNFLGQFKFTGGGSNYDVTVWMAKGSGSGSSSAVANTSSTFTLTSSQGSQIMANVTDIVTVAAGDYIQFYWYTSVAPSAGPNGIYLATTAAGTNPTRPASPAVKINVFNVG
jgi:hypothetical protein